MKRAKEPRWFARTAVVQQWERVAIWAALFACMGWKVAGPGFPLLVHL